MNGGPPAAPKHRRRLTIRASRVGAAVGLLAATWVAATPAMASDFWDEVKTPGLRVYRQHLRAARTALDGDDFDGARQNASDAIARIEDRPEAHVILGLALGELGRPAEGADAFTRALTLDRGALDTPEDGGQAARIAAMAGQYPLAARILERVLGRMPAVPQRAELYALFGDVLLTLGPSSLRDATIAYGEAYRHTAGGNMRALIGLCLALRRSSHGYPAEDDASPSQQPEGGRPPRDRTRSDDSAAVDEGVQMTALLAGRAGLDGIVVRLPIPATERAARRALIAESQGDHAAAQAAWRDAAADGPWRDHALAQLGTGRHAATSPVRNPRNATGTGAQTATESPRR